MAFGAGLVLAMLTGCGDSSQGKLAGPDTVPQPKGIKGDILKEIDSAPPLKRVPNRRPR